MSNKIESFQQKKKKKKNGWSEFDNNSDMKEKEKFYQVIMTANIILLF